MEMNVCLNLQIVLHPIISRIRHMNVFSGIINIFDLFVQFLAIVCLSEVVIYVHANS